MEGSKIVVVLVIDFEVSSWAIVCFQSTQKILFIILAKQKYHVTKLHSFDRKFSHQIIHFVYFQGLRKRVTALANKKVANNILHKWIPALVDHLHYVVSQTPSGQLRKEWWMSAVNHICNIHTHEYETFPVCRHGELPTHEIAEDGTKLVPAYLNPGRLVYNPLFKTSLSWHLVKKKEKEQYIRCNP